VLIFIFFSHLLSTNKLEVMNVSRNLASPLASEPMLKAEQVCEYLNISYRTFLRLVEEDDTFPPFKVRREWRCDPIALREWVMKQPSTSSHGEIEQIRTAKRRGRPTLSGTVPQKVK